MLQENKAKAQAQATMLQIIIGVAGAILGYGITLMHTLYGGLYS
jgi:hypothetical protein